MMVTCYIAHRETEAVKLLSRHIDNTPGLRLVGSNSDTLDTIERINRAEVITDMVFLDSEFLKPRAALKEPAALASGNAPVIFSAFRSELSATIFNWNPVDDLPHPVSYERFLTCIEKAKQQTRERHHSAVQPDKTCFFIQSEGKGKLIRIAREEIVFVESALNYLHIHLAQSSHATYLPIREMEEILSDGPFIRVHKSFLINRDKISVIEGNMIRLTNDKTIVLGPSYRKSFFEHIGAMLLKSSK